MALDTYTNLKAEIASYLNRSDLTTYIPDFITLAEQRILYGGEGQFPSEPLRIRAMETPATVILKAVVDGGTVGGSANAITLTPATAASSYAVGDTYSFTATASNSGATTANVSGLGSQAVVYGSASSALAGGEIVIGSSYTIYYDGTNFVLMPDGAQAPLPSGFVGFRSFYLDLDPRGYLDYMTPLQLDQVWGASSTGQPEAFSVVSDSLAFGPRPDTTYYLKTLYYKKFAGLSASQATNWLLTNAPGVYLYGSLLESAPFIGGDQDQKRLPMWHGLYLAACNGLQKQDSFDRFAAAGLQMRADHGNP